MFDCRQYVKPKHLAGPTLVCFVWLATACSVQAFKPSDATDPQTWGAARNVTQIGQLYFADQPDAATLDIAKTRGIQTIINLRAPGETDWDERTAAQSRGFEYVQIPIVGQSATLDADVMHAISAVVEAHEGQPVFIHCASANRAAAWFATHLVERRGLSEPEAIAIAEEVGLTNAGMKQRVRTYFDSQ